MSTKIFNGYYIPWMKLEELHQFMREFMGKINTESEEILNKTVAEMATRSYDSYTLGLLKGKKLSEQACPLVQAYTDLMTRNRAFKDKGVRDPFTDFGCAVCFIPAKEYNKIFCLLYSDQKSYDKIWEEMPGVVEYSYWNNTDKPDEISERDWNVRGLGWESVLGETGIPADVGFTIECGSKGLPFRERVEELIPPFDERVDDMVESVILHDKYHEFMSELAGLREEDHDPDFYKQSVQWLREQRGTEFYQEKKKEIRGKLKEDLTGDDLFTLFRDLEIHE